MTTKIWNKAMNGLALGAGLFFAATGWSTAEEAPTLESAVPMHVEGVPCVLDVAGMMVGPDGGVYVSGSGTPSPGCTGAQVSFVTKVTLSDGTVWTHVYEGAESNRTWGAPAVDASGAAYIPITYRLSANPGIELVKITNTGSLERVGAYPYGDPSLGGFATGVAYDELNNRLVALQNVFDFGVEKQAAVIAQYDVNLTLQDTRVKTATNGLYPAAGVGVDALGRVVMAGEQNAIGGFTYFADGHEPNSLTPAWQTEDDPSPDTLDDFRLRLAVGLNGESVVASQENGQSRLAARKFSPTGNITYRTGVPLESFGPRVAAGPGGEAYLTGYTQSDFLGAVVKLTSAGDVAWTLTNPLFYSMEAVATDVGGNLYTMGYLNEPVGLNDLYVAKFTASNERLFAGRQSAERAVAFVNEVATAPFRVGVRTEADAPKENVTVEFAFSSAPTGAVGYEVSPGSVTTGLDGVAETLMRLGDIPLEYRVSATCAACVPSSSTVTVDVCGKLKTAYFNQADAPWGPANYAFRDRPISERGCALTAYAMVLNYYREAFNLNYPGYTPLTLNAALLGLGSRGYSSDADVNFVRSSRLLTEDDLEALDDDQIADFSEQQLLTLLDSSLAQKEPVILTRVSPTSVSGKHYIVVMGRCGEDYLVFDPGRRAVTVWHPDELGGTRKILAIRRFRRVP